MRMAQISFAALMTLPGMTALASAQTTGIVGQEYESYTTGNCGSTYAYCYAVFPDNPSTSRIQIKHASCTMISNGLPFKVSLSAIDAQFRTTLKTVYLDVANSVIYGGANSFYSTVNAETSILIGPNRAPVILVESVGPITTLKCSISGVLVP